MELADLGYNAILEDYILAHKLENYDIGRVISEHKERYIVRTLNVETEAEITGNLRYSANGREDFPAVGDWVAMTSYDINHAIIYKVLPRFSIIKRQAVGVSGEIQIIATNIDFAFIVQAVDRDFNLNRLERYLTICNSSKVSPIIILSKTDLMDDLRIKEIIISIESRVHGVPIIAISNETESGYEKIKSTIYKGKTYCLLGSSGVGKSTLINNLSGKSVMKTGEISNSVNKGKHITTHRSLIILENGGMLVDNPGMREVGIADTMDGLENVFEKIVKLSENCKFKNCSHTNEIGCKVLEALDAESIDIDAYENYQKLEREKNHFESTLIQKRQKDKKFGKMMKNMKKDQKKHNF